MAYLALDIGAGSGRAIVGTIENGRVFLEEVHRFGNNPVKLGNTLHWNFLSLFDNIKQGIYLAVKKGYDLRGIAVDTWGVDFGLLDSAGNFLGNPVTYRDSRTQGMLDDALKIVSKEELYETTGIQQMEINTLFQLLSLNRTNALSLYSSGRLLFMPDLINYYLTGKAYNEYTIASTSQMLNAKTKQWEKTLFEKFDLPIGIMGEIIEPCNLIGNLKPEISEETGADNIKVFAVGSHDTASAIAAIPATGNNWAFLSSGTWSLLGVETDEPVLTNEALNNDFTNEGGVDGKILFMRNCTGLWLLQCLMTEWEKGDGQQHSYEYLLSECSKVLPFRSIINSDDPLFSNPPSMEKAIQDYCNRYGQTVPQTKGEIVRCVIESLAMKYLFVMEKLKECTRKDISELYVVGGGSRNELLNQFTANALDVTVVTGLTESTAIGNVIQQAIADGCIADLKEGRKIVCNSFDFKKYIPQNTREWKECANKVSHLFI